MQTFHHHVLCQKYFRQLSFLALVLNLSLSLSSKLQIFSHSLLFAVRIWLLDSLASLL